MVLATFPGVHMSILPLPSWPPTHACDLQFARLLTVGLACNGDTTREMPLPERKPSFVKLPVRPLFQASLARPSFVKPTLRGPHFELPSVGGVELEGLQS